VVERGLQLHEKGVEGLMFNQAALPRPTASGCLGEHVAIDVLRVSSNNPRPLALVPQCECLVDAAQCTAELRVRAFVPLPPGPMARVAA